MTQRAVAGHRGTLDEVIRSRRSIRRYEPQDVPDVLVREILDLARHAPSSMNGQPWCFIVIRDPDLRRRLAAIKNVHCPSDKREAYPADFLALAPVVVAVCVERHRAYDRERENGIMAAAHLLLAAQARGLGGVYLSAYQPLDSGLARDIRDLLRISPEVEPIALVPLGFPAESPVPKRLRPLAELIHYEQFGERASDA